MPRKVPRLARRKPGLVRNEYDRAGASITYWAASLGGRPRVDLMAKWFRIDPQHIVQAEQKFHRWGVSIVFFGRMIPGVRTLINIPAGLARMPFLKFLTYTLIGAYIWCTLMLAIGYFMGHEWYLISDFVRQVAPWLLGAGLLLWAGIFTRRMLVQRRGNLVAIPGTGETLERNKMDILILYQGIYGQRIAVVIYPGLVETPPGSRAGLCAIPPDCGRHPGSGRYGRGKPDDATS